MTAIDKNEKIISFSKHEQTLSFSELDMEDGETHTELHSISVPSQLFFAVHNQYFAFANVDSISLIDLLSFTVFEVPYEVRIEIHHKFNTNIIQTIFKNNAKENG